MTKLLHNVSLSKQQNVRLHPHVTLSELDKSKIQTSPKCFKILSSNDKEVSYNQDKDTEEEVKKPDDDREKENRREKELLSQSDDEKSKEDPEEGK